MSKYTRELLEPLVKESKTFSEVMRKLGKKQSGSIATYITKIIKDLQIDTSHFLGRFVNRGVKKGGLPKKTWQEVLIFREGSTKRQEAWRLRRALMESGVKYKCKCGITDMWQGQQIRLQVNHKNGNYVDDRAKNLEFLCPNCHSQTSNFNGSKGLTGLCSNAGVHRAKRLRKKAKIT